MILPPMSYSSNNNSDIFFFFISIDKLHTPSLDLEFTNPLSRNLGLEHKHIIEVNLD